MIVLRRIHASFWEVGFEFFDGLQHQTLSSDSPSRQQLNFSPSQSATPPDAPPTAICRHQDPCLAQSLS